MTLTRSFALCAALLASSVFTVTLRAQETKQLPKADQPQQTPKAVQPKQPLKPDHDHPHGGSMPVGHHEFRVLAGDGKYFLSHFPRLSSIHAFQYIVEVSFDNAAKAALEQDLRNDVTHERRYQLEPFKKDSASANRGDDEDDWVLPDTLKDGKSFTGDIFYFVEGQRIAVASNITVTVKGIVWKRELNPNFPRPKVLTYLLFGTPKAAFLAHEVTAPQHPGGKVTEFDQVVSVEILSSSKEVTPTSIGKLVIVPNVDNTLENRLKTGQRVQLSLSGSDQHTIEVVVKHELHLNSHIPTQR